MARHIVEDENDLPRSGNPTGDQMHYFLRSKTDPEVLMASRTDNVYLRNDGQPWAHGAYREAFRGVDGKMQVVIEVAAAYCE